MNDDRHIHEDVSNENMHRIDSRLSNVEGEIKAINARLEGFSDTFAVAINGFNDRMSDLHTRINDIKTDQSHNLTKWGIIVAVVVGVVQIAISLFLKSS